MTLTSGISNNNQLIKSSEPLPENPKARARITDRKVVIWYGLFF